MTILCVLVAVLAAMSVGALPASCQGPAAAEAAPAVEAARVAEAAPREPPLPAIVAPALARQGDPVIAWLVCAVPRDNPVATLAGPDGKRAVSAAGFDARPLFADDRAAPGSAAAQASAAGATAAASPLSGAIVYGFILGLPDTLSAGSYTLSACGASARIEVAERAFISETIPLDQKNTDIRTSDDERKIAEAKRLYEILGRANPSSLYAGIEPFIVPLAEEARRSSFFGDRRLYAYSDGSKAVSVHAGIDFAVVEGTPVLACAAGKVALAADRVVTGKTLVLEHLPGLYSIYMHLSSLDLVEGAAVERGGRIGLSGSTGLSTGPHLHWELRANSAMVDPDLLASPQVLDKALIINTIRALIEGR